MTDPPFNAIDINNFVTVHDCQLLKQQIRPNLSSFSSFPVFHHLEFVKLIAASLVVSHFGRSCPRSVSVVTQFNGKQSQSFLKGT